MDYRCDGSKIHWKELRKIYDFISDTMTVAALTSVRESGPRTVGMSLKTVRVGRVQGRDEGV